MVSESATILRRYTVQSGYFFLQQEESNNVNLTNFNRIGIAAVLILAVICNPVVSIRPINTESIRLIVKNSIKLTKVSVS